MNHNKAKYSLLGFTKLWWKFTAILSLLVTIGCQTPESMSSASNSADVLNLPFIKNSPNECYYLDEFMPTPDNMVTGKTGTLSLRYYTYEQATFKDWSRSKIILSFYSNDERCWSLFEEYYVGEAM
jgi:hypothetical protein